MNKDWVQKAILARVARSKKIRRPKGKMATLILAWV